MKWRLVIIHRVRGLSFLAVVFAVTITLIIAMINLLFISTCGLRLSKIDNSFTSKNIRAHCNRAVILH